MLLSASTVTGEVLVPKVNIQLEISFPAGVFSAVLLSECISILSHDVDTYVYKVVVFQSRNPKLRKNGKNTERHESYEQINNADDPSAYRTYPAPLTFTLAIA